MIERTRVPRFPVAGATGLGGLLERLMEVYDKAHPRA